MVGPFLQQQPVPQELGCAQLSSWAVQVCPDTFPGKTRAVGNSRPLNTIQVSLAPHMRLVSSYTMKRHGKEPGANPQGTGTWGRVALSPQFWKAHMHS